MIFDAVEAITTVLTANFSADFTALATAKGVADLPGAPTFVKRQRAEMFASLNVTLPAIGIYILRSSTMAKWQSVRDPRSTGVFDWYARGSDPVLLAQQTELAAEVMLRTVDRMAGSGTGGVFGAGELPDSITIELTDGYEKSIEPNYSRRATVTFTVYDRDSGL